MEKNINIKSLLKRVGSLLTAYVLVLGSFSAVVPFLFAQKAGALEYTDSDLEYTLIINPDGSKSINQKPGEPVLFKVKVVDNDSLNEPVSVLDGYKGKAYILANYYTAKLQDKGTKRLGKIVQVPNDRVDCSDVDMSFVDEDDSGSAQVNLSSGDKAEASFCYVISTNCVSSVGFIASFPNGSLVDGEVRKYTKELVVRLDNENTGLDFNMSEGFDKENSTLSFKWDAVKNSEGVMADKYKIELVAYPLPYLSSLIYISEDIPAIPEKASYSHDYSIGEWHPGDEIDDEFGWCLIASFESGPSSKFCSPIKRFNLVNPTITLNGKDMVDIELGETYVDAGATAHDFTDGDLTDDIVISGDTVKTAILGSYVITYNVSDRDLEGNKAKTVTRTVNVVPRKITIKVKDAQKIYHEDDPEFDVVITPNGLLKGDKPKDILKDILAKRQIGEDVGLYQVMLSSLDSSNPNYDITFEPGNLEIIAKKVKVIVNSHTKIDGEENPVFTYKIVDENGKTVDDETIIVKINRLAGEEVGEYELKASAEDNKNYIIDVSHQGVLEIVKKPAQVAVIPAAIARATPTTYYDRVGVATADEPKKEETKKVEEKKDSNKKEEEKKQTWKIFGFAWYWWGLAILAVGALRWWFGGASLAGGGKDTTNSSDK